MEKLKNDLVATKLLVEFIAMLIKGNFQLNENMDNNYAVCKKISNKLIDLAKIDFKVNGRENVPNSGPTMFFPNHRSFFDIMLLISAVERNMNFAAAKELYQYPILKNYLQALGCISIDRTASATDFSVLKMQIKEMTESNKKTSQTVFAEGECNYNSSKIFPFKKGGFITAGDLDSYIVPTYIDVRAIKNIGRWTIPTGEVSVSFGKAFKPSDISSKKINLNELSKYTYEQVLELQKRLITDQIQQPYDSVPVPVLQKRNVF